MSRANSEPALLLDTVRLYVVIPIVVITFMSMLARHYVMGLQTPKKVELVNVMERSSTTARAAFCILMKRHAGLVH